MDLADDNPRLLPIALRSELLAHGYSTRSLAAGLRTGALARPRRGAYVDGPSWAKLTEEERYAVRCRAAYRQARTGVVLSHASALAFLGGPLWDTDLREVHLTRSDGRTGRRHAGVRQHCGKLMDGDTVDAYGMSFSAPTKATLEMTTLGNAEYGLVVANHFLHTGETTAAALRARYDSNMSRWPHTLSTDLVLRLADGRIESVGESRTLYFLWQHGFRKPEPQFEVHDGGELIARLDFALPEHGIWIEFDGRIKYEKYRRDGESVSDAVLREKYREEKIAELTGWRCLRITWADLAAPRELERRLRRLIDAVAAARRTR